MSEPGTGKDAGTAPDFAILGLLEKAGQFQWMLKILTAALFLDCALMVTKGENILSYPWENLSWSASIGALIVGGVVFSLLIAAVLPVLGGAAAWLVRTAYIYIPLLRPHSDTDYRRGRHQVMPGELLEHADRLQSDYILAKYREHEENARRARAESGRLGQESFNTLLFLLMNLYLTSTTVQSTIWRLTRGLEADLFAVSMLLMTVALMSLACISWCGIFRNDDWITYAPLYDQIEKKREEERRRMRDLA